MVAFYAFYYVLNEYMLKVKRKAPCQRLCVFLRTQAKKIKETLKRSQQQAVCIA